MRHPILIVAGGVVIIVAVANLALSCVPQTGPPQPQPQPPAAAHTSAPAAPTEPTYPVTKIDAEGRWSDQVSAAELGRVDVASRFARSMVDRDHRLPYPGTRQAEAEAISVGQARRQAAERTVPSEEDFAATPAYFITFEISEAFVNDAGVVTLNGTTADQLGARTDTSAELGTEPCAADATGYCVSTYTPINLKEPREDDHPH